jgi:F-type H+-transporting ATPase subunit b
MAEEVHTVGTEVPAEEHHEATAFGLNAGWFVALAMLVVFAILIWKKVPGAIAKSLDDKIAAIRSQLDEAKALREEAEALKKEYEKKAKSADKEAKAMIERAGHEAEAIIAKADADAAALFERRTRLAEDKIAAEERTAINELRAAAATAAARAAERLIAERHDAAADAKLVDQAIAGLGKQ